MPFVRVLVLPRPWRLPTSRWECSTPNSATYWYESIFLIFVLNERSNWLALRLLRSRSTPRIFAMDPYCLTAVSKFGTFITVCRPRFRLTHPSCLRFIKFCGRSYAPFTFVAIENAPLFQQLEPRHLPQGPKTPPPEGRRRLRRPQTKTKFVSGISSEATSAYFYFTLSRRPSRPTAVLKTLAIPIRDRPAKQGLVTRW